MNVAEEDRQRLLDSTNKRAWVRPDGHIVEIPDNLTHETYLMEHENVKSAHEAGWMRYHRGENGSIFIDAPSPEAGLAFLRAVGLFFGDSHIVMHDYLTGQDWVRGVGGPGRRFFRPPQAHEETKWL